MMFQRPKRKKAKSATNDRLNACHSGSLTPFHALPNSPPQFLPPKTNGHYGSTRHEGHKLPFETAPPQQFPGASSGSWAGPPKGPMLAPCYFSPLSAARPVDKHGADRIPDLTHQKPALYDLIYSKFDAIITSIDEESFSGDRQELGR